MLLEALTIARVARLRKRRTWSVAADPTRDAVPVLETVTTLDTLPSLDRLSEEAGRAGADQLGDQDRGCVERLRALDPYVADYGHDDRRVETDYPALKALGVRWDWLDAPGVQRALRAIRDEQQEVIAELARQAASRPLAFARTGVRFWPRDLGAGHVRRLDRWATDPGFEHDMFEVRRPVQIAHAARDADIRAAQRIADAGTPVISRYPDGLSGWREGAAPVYRDDGVRVAIAAFDDPTGQPSDQLLMLLTLVARHPRLVELATDGKPMAAHGRPAMLAPLLHSLRDDERVAALVIETVRMSREAGVPIWPDSIKAAMHTHVATTVEPMTPGAKQGQSRPAPDLGKGLSR